MNNSSILITGATGTIGSFIADVLLEYAKTSNLKVYVAGRNVNILQERFPHAIPLKYELNSSIMFKYNFDYVIHAAGNAYPAAFARDPVGTIMGNVESTSNLLDYMKEHGGKRFLYLSSGEVYGQGDLSLEEFEESYSGYVDTLSPRFCYPISKRMVENLCASYFKEYGLEVVIARPCHTYGPNITKQDNRANAQFIRSAVCGEQIVLKSAGKQLRSYNYVADCASAIITVLLNGNSGEAYNIANSHTRVTIAELAEEIGNISGTEVVFEIPDEMDLCSQSPIAKQVLSSKKLEQLGWKSSFCLVDGIKNTIEVLKEENI